MDYINRKISNEQQMIYSEIEKNGAIKYIDKYSKYLGKYIGVDKVLILDIGGGAGYFANAIKDFYNQKNTNSSVNVIDYCKYDEWLLFNNINFINESAFTALDRFRDSSIDICFLNLILHHLTNDTYKETRQAQKKLLEIVYKKIKSNGYVCINECYYQNPIINDLSIPVVYLLSSSKLPMLVSISKLLGSKSAGVGVCFLSSRSWIKTFYKCGFKITSNHETPWRWIKNLLIREKFFTFILSKNDPSGLGRSKGTVSVKTRLARDEKSAH